MKSSVDEIRARFDADVERFSNLETGQSATIDAPLSLELIAQSAASVTPQARALVDIGCGAGNYSLKLLERLPLESITLLDLSQPMLDRAVHRIGQASQATQRDVQLNALQVDVREVELAAESCDVIVAAAVLHHLRTDDEWRQVFASFHRWLRPGGSVWISDLVEHRLPQVQGLMWRRYGEYLETLGGPDYRDKVYAYVAREDTPRPLMDQLELLGSVGFSAVDVLHKNSVFAAFGAVK